jgi:hypothetical protein
MTTSVYVSVASGMTRVAVNPRMNGDASSTAGE